MYFSVEYFFMEDICEHPFLTRYKILNFLSPVSNNVFGIDPRKNEKSGRHRYYMVPKIYDALRYFFSEELIECANIFGSHAYDWVDQHNLDN